MAQRFLSILTLCLLLMPAVQAQPYTTAEEVLNAHLEATGGTDAWRAVTTRQVNIEVTIEFGDQLFTMAGDQWEISSGYSLQLMTSEMMGNQTRYITPEGGFQDAGGQRQEFADTSQVVLDVQAPIKRELAILESGDTITLLDEAEFDGTPVYAIQVDTDTRYYDRESLLLLAIQDENEVTRYIDDYRDVNGLQVPFYQTVDIPQGDQFITQSVVFTSIEYNVEITPEDLAAKVEGM